MNHSGGLRKMAMQSVENCSTGITVAADIKTEGVQSFSLDPEKSSSLERGKETLYGYGTGLLTLLDKQGLTVPFSETKANTSRVSLSDRLTPSLISAGLIKGIIPMLMRDGSDQQILDFVLRPQGGENVEKQKADS
jgi:hypothetical protein